MRRYVFAEALLGLEDALLVETLQGILQGARMGDGACRELAAELPHWVPSLEAMAYARRSRLYELALERGLRDVSRLFLGDRVRGNPTVEEASLENEHLALSLGERKALSRRGNRFALDRAMHDRNPAVITALLDNPRVVESDVVRVAAMRPTRPEVLTLIAKHPKWSSRPEVRFALCCNPWTPASVSRPLVRSLLAPRLREMLGMSSIPEVVREAARDALGGR
jgi:hypothetical protein